nr:MAG TPA: hypothetical protein [Caudoviricetes sp.]
MFLHGRLHVCALRFSAARSYLTCRSVRHVPERRQTAYNGMFSKLYSHT